jgi:hypothetical protein
MIRMRTLPHQAMKKLYHVLKKAKKEKLKGSLILLSITTHL